jgi:hypothetical protein
MVSALLPLLSGLLVKRKTRPVYYPLAMVVLGLMAGLIAFIIDPGTMQFLLTSIFSLFTWQAGTTVMEMQPILLIQGHYSFMAVLANYMLSFFLSLVCLIILVYQVFNKSESNKMLLLIWSIILLMATLAMRRFAYYYAVNVSILTGIICWWPLQWILSRLRGLKADVDQKAIQKRKKRKGDEQRRSSLIWWRVALAGMAILMLLVVYYPNIGPLPNGEKPAIDLASRPLFAPPNAWCTTLDWLRSNSPEPFDSDVYYGEYQELGKPGGFTYTGTAYSVLSWWDYGYWITRISKRVPGSNPGSGQRGEAYYFTAQDEVSAGRMINNWGVHYVIVDNEIAAYDGKYHALATLSGGGYNNYFEMFIQKQGNRYASALLFFPEYYRSMVVRLFNFEGKAVAPESVPVIRYAKRQSTDGQVYKEIIEQKQFATYLEAERFVSENKGSNYIIVGDDPNVSPVPLEALTQYTQVYTSDNKAKAVRGSQQQIKVFKYQRDVVPLAGNWNMDKNAEVGLWQPDGSHFIKNVNSEVNWDTGKAPGAGSFGYPTDIPITGDWNGDGYDEIGVWRPSDFYFYLDYDANGDWNPEKGDKRLGPFGWWFTNTPVAGDWNGDGKDEIGIWRYIGLDKGCYFLLDVNADGLWNPEKGDVKLGPFGNVGDLPVTGDWTGDGRDKVGVWSPPTCYFMLDTSGDGKWDEKSGDRKLGPYGESFNTPVTGDWKGIGRGCPGVWNPKTREFRLNVIGDGNWDSTSGNIKIRVIGN